MSMVLVFLAAATGARFRPGSWYATLRKPTWTPPNNIFAPVWTVLYLMMALSSWLIFIHTASERIKTAALALYLVQLCANALWSWLFFHKHRIFLAWLDLLLLLIVLTATFALFLTISPLAGGLIAPYLLWVAFAFLLNTALWIMNVLHSRPTAK